MPSARKIAVPATRSSATVLKARRRIVVVLLVAAVLSGFVSTFVVLTQDPPPPPATVAVDSRLAAVAEQAGRDFLAGRNSTVPAAKGVNTDFSGQPSPTPTEDNPLTKDQVDAILNGVSGINVGAFALQGETTHRLGDADEQLIHLIRFRVTLNAAPFILTVPVLDDPTYGTTLAGTPALLATSSGRRDDVDPADYTNYSAAETSVSPQVEASIEKWVAAYSTAGRASDALRTVTGDQDPSRTYSGLGRVTPATLVSIVSAVPYSSTGGPAGQLVQIQVALPFNAATGFALNATYDLYVVTEGDPAQPPVVAWGPAGSEESLTPYMNAD